MSKFLPFLFIIAMFLSFTAHAGETPWASADQVRARLLSGGGDSAAVEIELAQGWHSYWYAPGDAGLAPVFNWQGSENFKSVEVAWPYPQRFDELGMTTFGYEGTIIFPVTVQKIAEGAKTKLNLALDIMVCKDICIPQQLKMFIDLEDAPTPQAAIIDNAKRKIPAESPQLAIETIVAGPDALVIAARSEKGFDGADIIAVIEDAAVTTKPQFVIDAADSKKAIITIPKPSGAQSMTGLTAGHNVTVTLIAGGKSVEKFTKF